MTPLEISLALDRSAVLTGERCDVAAMVRNVGDSEVAVPSTEQSSPFTYLLAAKAAAGPTYQLSVQDAEASKYENPVEPNFGDVDDLAPGAESSWSDDLAELHFEGFAPGAYAVEALYPDERGPYRSAPAELEILPLEPAAAHHLTGPHSEALCSIVAHRDDDELVFLHRESDPETPFFSALQRRATRPPATQLRGLTSAVWTYPDTTGRWFAWLEANHLAARRCWGDAVIELPEQSLSLDDAQLIRPGYDAGDGAALFFVVGTNEQGAQLCCYRAHADGWTLQWQQAWGGHLSQDVRAFRTAQGDSTFYWLDESAQALRYSTYGADGDPPEQDSHLLFVSTTPIVCWDVPAIESGQPAKAHLVTGPDDDGRMNYVRTALPPATDPAGPTIEAFAPPPEPVDQWSVFAGFIDDPPVAASTKDTVWLRAVDTGGQWLAVQDQAAGVSCLTLFSLDGVRPRLCWIDRIHGFAVRGG